MKIQAVIFDMDGLMLDTERLDREHFCRAAADFGYRDIEPVYLQTVGINATDTKRHFQRAMGQDFPYEELRRRWRQYSADHARKFGIPLKPELTPLLERLDSHRMPRAVATSTRRVDAVALLESVGLLRSFAAVVGGDEVVSGKPHPEIFLTAAQRLRVEPKACVVFEDSPAGIEAAHRAGMTPILVPDLIVPPEQTLKMAFRVLKSLDEALIFFTGSNDFASS